MRKIIEVIKEKENDGHCYIVIYNDGSLELLLDNSKGVCKDIAKINFDRAIEVLYFGSENQNIIYYFY